MDDGSVIIQGAIEALKQVRKLIKLLKTEKDRPRLGAVEVIAKLRLDGSELIQGYIQDIDKLISEFSNIDPMKTKTIAQLQSETWYWHRWQYKTLEKFRPKVNAISSQLRILLADILALAHCREAEDIIAQLFQQATDGQDQLDIDFNRLPAAIVLDNLRRQAVELQNDLRDL